MARALLQATVADDDDDEEEEEEGADVVEIDDDDDDDDDDFEHLLGKNASGDKTTTTTTAAQLQVNMQAQGTKPFKLEIGKQETFAKLHAAAHKNLVELGVIKKSAKIKLLFDGDALELDDTPASLDMEDGDTVDIAT